MICIERYSSSPYTTGLSTVPITEAINGGHPLPLTYVNDNENFINDSFLDYIRPLVEDLPEYARLDLVEHLHTGRVGQPMDE